MKQGEVLSRTSQCSRSEAFATGAQDLVTISPFHWHILIPASFAYARRIPANREVIFERQELGSAPVIFEPMYQSEDGEQTPLPPGKDVLIFLNPINPAYALFCDTQVRVIGLVFTNQLSHRLDRDYLLECFRKRNALTAQIWPSADAHNEAKAKEREARRDTNRQLFLEHGIDLKNPPRKEKKNKTQKPAKGGGKSKKKTDHESASEKFKF